MNDRQSNERQSKAYIKPLCVAFEAAGDADRAIQMARYMKDHFAFFGIQATERRQLQRAFLHTHGKPEIALLPAIVHALWALPQRELQYAAMDFLTAAVRRLPAEQITLCETLICEKSWWDSVDALAGRIVGGLLLRHPQLVSRRQDWLASDNIWLNRTALLYQLHYKDGIDLDFLFQACRQLHASDEFFIQKAIGWALRQAAKRHSAAVLQFVDQQPLAPLSRREALKHFPDDS